jgi:acyl carrier protein
MPADLAENLKRILTAQLGPSYPPGYFNDDTPLLGAIPELDSMAVVGILTAVEEELGVTVDDDEISADAFSTFRALEEFLYAKRRS